MCRLQEILVIELAHTRRHFWHVNLREHKLHRSTDYRVIPFGENQNSSPAKSWGLLPGTYLYCCRVCTPPPPSGPETECTRCCAGLCCLWPEGTEGKKGQMNTEELREGRQKKTSTDAFKSNPSLKMESRIQLEHKYIWQLLTDLYREEQKHRGIDLYNSSHFGDKQCSQWHWLRFCSNQMHIGFTGKGSGTLKGTQS